MALGADPSFSLGGYVGSLLVTFFKLMAEHLDKGSDAIQHWMWYYTSEFNNNKVENILPFLSKPHQDKRNYRI